MNAFQYQNPERVPVPTKKFFATFVDLTDVITDCREVSIEGETFLEGKRGNGSSSIPFEHIADVSFLQEGDKFYGIIKLKDGNALQLALNKNQKAYGHTKYGTFQIKFSELKKMIFKK